MRSSSARTFACQRVETLPARDAPAFPMSTASRDTAFRARPTSTSNGAASTPPSIGRRPQARGPRSRPAWAALLEAALTTLDGYMPGIRRPHRRSRGAHAGGSGTRMGHGRRPYPPRRAGARSALHDAAVARVEPIPHAHQRPVAVQRRHAPGTRAHRWLGLECSARDARGEVVRITASRQLASAFGLVRGRGRLQSHRGGLRPAARGFESQTPSQPPSTARF